MKELSLASDSGDVLSFYIIVGQIRGYSSNADGFRNMHEIQTAKPAATWRSRTMKVDGCIKSGMSVVLSGTGGFKRGVGRTGNRCGCSVIRKGE